MRRSHRMLLPMSALAWTTFAGLWPSPVSGQEAAVSGSGNANYLAIWRNSTTLGSSAIYVTGGEVGIGTTTPAAKLEVNGTAQVDGILQVNGSIYSVGPLGSSPLIQAPSDNNNFSAGLSAMGSPENGIYDTAVGNYALALNQTGIENVAVGESALFLNSGGNNNVGVGYGALIDNTNGNNNTAVGSGALVGGQNTTGSSNTALGANAGANLITGSNNIYIANSGESSESGVTRIGAAGSQTKTFIAGIYGVHTSTANAVPVLIDSNGNLGTVSSSRRYKEDIQDMADASSGLMRLRPVTFRYKKALDDGSKPVQYGLIAEEVAEVYPDLVARSADGRIETVKYQVLDSMLLNELQKQNTTIAAQKERIHSLEERLARVEAALERTAVVTSSR